MILVRNYFIFFLCVLYAGSLLAKKRKRLPMLSNIGIIPVQVENEKSLVDFTDSIRHMKISFPIAIRDSYRFRVLDDELVASLWENPDGRETLKKEYELSAFLSLSVASDDDELVVFCRILDPNLKVLLQESLRVRKDAIIYASYEKILEKLRDLSYTTINMLPLDIYVRSLHGKYITLSGGVNQGLYSGDKIDIYNVKLQTMHPAHNGWHLYKELKVGQAQVLETRDNTAVAKIIKQTFESAVHVGDGIKWPKINSRIHFSDKVNALKKRENVYDNIVLKGIATESDKKSKKDPKKEVPKDLVVKALEEEDQSEKTRPSVPSEAILDGTTSSEQGLFDYLHKFDSASLGFGPNIWGFKGAVKMKLR